MICSGILGGFGKNEGDSYDARDVGTRPWQGIYKAAVYFAV